VNAIYLPLTFISGVFFSVETMPGFLQAIADVSPLTYLLDLIRGLVLEGGADGWGEDVLVLAAWGLVGLVASLRVFRWEPREA
jgi:ABC-type multidrug transport system permease subunit